jgi:hypothetical protein
MKSLMPLACAFALPGIALAADPCFQLCNPRQLAARVKFRYWYIWSKRHPGHPALNWFELRIRCHSAPDDQRFFTRDLWQRIPAGEPHCVGKRVVGGSLVALSPFGHQRRKTDRIDRVTWRCHSWSARGLWRTRQPPSRSGSRRKFGHRSRFKKPLLLGRGRLYKVSRSIG